MCYKKTCSNDFGGAARTVGNSKGSSIISNNIMDKPFTFANLTPYIKDEVDTIIAEEYNALSEETKLSVNLRDYCLLGTGTRRLIRENTVRLGSGELKALLDSFIATSKNYL